MALAARRLSSPPLALVDWSYNHKRLIEQSSFHVFKQSLIHLNRTIPVLYSFWCVPGYCQPAQDDLSSFAFCSFLCLPDEDLRLSDPPSRSAYSLTAPTLTISPLDHLISVRSDSHARRSAALHLDTSLSEPK